MNSFYQFVEEKIHTPRALKATGIDQDYISKWKEAGAKIINVYDLIESARKNPRKYEKCITIGLMTPDIPKLFKKFLGCNDWTWVYSKKLRIFGAATDYFMSYITLPNNCTIAFVPNNIYSYDNDLEHAVSTRELVFLMRYPEKASNVTFVLGGYDFISKKEIRDLINKTDEEVREYLYSWKSKLNRGKSSVTYSDPKSPKYHQLIQYKEKGFDLNKEVDEGMEIFGDLCKLMNTPIDLGQVKKWVMDILTPLGPYYLFLGKANQQFSRYLIRFKKLYTNRNSFYVDVHSEFDGLINLFIKVFLNHEINEEIGTIINNWYSEIAEKFHKNNDVDIIGEEDG